MSIDGSNYPVFKPVLPEILKRSKSQKQEEALSEWEVGPTTKLFSPEDNRKCLCGNINVVYACYFKNKETGYSILLDGGCIEQISEDLRKDAFATVWETYKRHMNIK